MVITIMPSSNILLPQTRILGYGSPALPHQRWKIPVDPLCLLSYTLTSLFIIYSRILLVIILGIRLQIITCSILASMANSQPTIAQKGYEARSTVIRPAQTHSRT